MIYLISSWAKTNPTYMLCINTNEWGCRCLLVFLTAYQYIRSSMHICSSGTLLLISSYVLPYPKQKSMDQPVVLCLKYRAFLVDTHSYMHHVDYILLGYMLSFSHFILFPSVSIVTYHTMSYGGLSCHISQWASCQIRELAGCACAGNAGNDFPVNDFKRNS